MKNYTASCAVCFHQEGLLAHTTLLSIATTRKFAEQSGLTVELSITLDSTDILTENIVREHPALKDSDIIDTVTYGDLGLSRNHAIRNTSGKFIICMDGDDYYSENYIFSCVTEASKNKNVVVYPEYIFSFGRQNSWRRVPKLDNTPYSPYTLFSVHPYGSSLTACREIFIHLPFVKSTPGFGYEDWHWNCEAIAHGFEHKYAKDTVLFYRRKNTSLCLKYSQNKVVIPPSKFFSLLPHPERHLSLQRGSNIPHIDITWKTLAKFFLFSVLRNFPRQSGEEILNLLREWQEKRKFKKYKKITLATKLAVFPHSIQEALFSIMKIDGILHPMYMPDIQQEQINNNELPGKIYAALWHDLIKQIEKIPYDLVLVTPHMKIGGAALMAINYLRSAFYTRKRVLCLTTLQSTPPTNFSSGIKYFNLNPYLKKLSSNDKEAIFTRLLLELAPKVIHIVNDWEYFHYFLNHTEALGQYSRLVISIFSDIHEESDICYGPGTALLRKFYPNLHKVITDNLVTAKYWQHRFGLPENFFQPVYGIINNVTPEILCPIKRSHVLWASRICEEKRLDILLSIAITAPEFIFDIYGEPDKNFPNNFFKELKQLPNVRFYGKYKDFSNIPTTKYFAFLYTTQYDGLPNVLLEAVAAGLPVIAPNRGGISDFITNDTGWLVENNTDVNAYVKALRFIRDNPNVATQRWACAQQLLTERHTEKKFMKSLYSAYAWEC